jgi:hypothetical protein
MEVTSQPADRPSSMLFSQGVLTTWLVARAPSGPPVGAGTPYHRCFAYSGVMTLSQLVASLAMDRESVPASTAEACYVTPPFPFCSSTTCDLADEP